MPLSNPVLFRVSALNRCVASVGSRPGPAHRGPQRAPGLGALGNGTSPDPCVSRASPAPQPGWADTDRTSWLRPQPCSGPGASETQVLVLEEMAGACHHCRWHPHPPAALPRGPSHVCSVLTPPTGGGASMGPQPPLPGAWGRPPPTLGSRKTDPPATPPSLQLLSGTRSCREEAGEGARRKTRHSNCQGSSPHLRNTRQRRGEGASLPKPTQW